MVKWKIIYTKDALKDANTIRKTYLNEKIKKLIEYIESSPLIFPPPLEKLNGSDNTYSRRINNKHRLVYKVEKEANIIKILSMWGHYDDN